MQYTLSIIKPDAVRRHLVGAILQRFEQAGLTISAMKMLQLSKEQAEGFYCEHQGKPFFEHLVTFMTSEPIVVVVLSKENAVSYYRTLIGATDPQNAANGTIRKEFALSLRENSVHGSDSIDSAKREIAYFFSHNEIY